MGKVGRNDPCKCGSNIKYKKCCLRKDELAHMVSNASFADLDPVDIFSTLSALSLVPENLGKGITLDKALILMGNTNPSGADSADLDLVLKWLNDSKDFDDARRMEDPPEGLFTENLSYHGGNYILYPGVQDNPTFILNQLLAAVFSDENLPKEYLSSILSHSRFLLEISNRVASLAGHQRWMTYPDTGPFPMGIERNLLPAYKKAVILSENEMKEICRIARLQWSEALSFIVDLSSKDLRHPYDFYNNPFHTRPILKVGDTFVVAHLPGIISALRHYILVLAKRTSFLNQVIHSYKNCMWRKIDEALNLLNFKYLEELSGLKESSVEGHIYRFDTDKICVVIHTWDDGANYDERIPFGHEDSKIKTQVIENKGSSAIDALRKSKSYSGDKIFLMLVTSGLGRDSMLGFNKLPYNDQYIGITSADLVTLGFQRNPDIDAITLWNYSIAEDELEENNVVVRKFSFLDGLAFFLDKKESFYLSDDEFYNMITLPTDGGKPMRERAKRVSDFHNIVLPSGQHLEEVTRLNGESSPIPIYVPLQGLGVRLMMAIEGYSAPVWVAPLNVKNEFTRSDYFVFCDAVAYWIWQITVEVTALIPSLGSKPLLIYYDIVSSADNTCDLSWEVDEKDDSTFKLLVPSSLNQAEPNMNEGERKIVKALLEIMSEIGSRNGSQKISDTKINEITDQIAPRGIKKKINHIDVELHPEQFPGRLPREPKLREFYVGRNADNLGTKVVSKLTSPLATVDPVPSDRRKEVLDSIKLIHKEKLLSMVSAFDRLTILSKVIELHESVVKQRAFTSDTAASSIACYSTIREKAEFLKTEFASLTSLAIGLRFLVEFIMSTSWTGGLKDIPQTEIEEILATSYVFVSWGMMGEEIRCRVVDHQLAILKSGRIGLDGSLRDGFESYFGVKVLEGIETQVYGWSKSYSNFSQEKMKEFRSAFFVEFNIQYDNFKSVVSNLIAIMFDCSETTLSFSIPELQKLVCKEGVSESDLDLVLKAIGMQPRLQWDTVPDGFTMSDIEPWKFARKLSFMHKPLLIVADDRVMYGPRHFAVAVRHFIGSMMSGEIRAEYFSSEEMQRYIGSQVEEKGFEFERVFTEFVRSFNIFGVETSVSIAPAGTFSNEEDIGDIDVLLIDVTNKRAILVECKEIDPGRTAIEVGAEIDRLILDKPKKPSRMTMHLKRHDWFHKNWETVLKKYKLPSGAWKIQSIFLTSEEIPAPRIKDLKLPVYSYTELLRDGIRVLGTRANSYEVEVSI